MTRKTSEYVNENGTVVRVHKVTEDTAGGVYVTGVGNRNVTPGEYLVEDNAGSYTVVGDLKGYSAVDVDVDRDVDVRGSKEFEAGDSVEESDEYDPKHYTVGAVNRYLDSVDEVEQERVVAAEKAGKNRKGIVEGR